MKNNSKIRIVPQGPVKPLRWKPVLANPSPTPQIIPAHRHPLCPGRLSPGLCSTREKIVSVKIHESNSIDRSFLGYPPQPTENMRQTGETNETVSWFGREFLRQDTEKSLYLGFQSSKNNMQPIYMLGWRGYMEFMPLNMMLFPLWGLANRNYLKQRSISSKT